MPDRSQAGSAGLRNGSNIELMQNRRINGYDAYGIFENLDDKDSSGHGIPIRASYFMQIFNRDKNSAQRAKQRELEQPILINYSNKFQRSNTPKPRALVQQSKLKMSSLATKLATSKEVKTLVYATAQNEIMLRLSNLQDSFDQNAENCSVDLHSYAHQLYQEANPNIKQPKFKIEETTLTGQSAYNYRSHEQTKWVTNEPKSHSLAQMKKRPVDDISEDKYVVTLEP